MEEQSSALTINRTNKQFDMWQHTVDSRNPKQPSEMFFKTCK